jgi:hypothetical protein
VIGSLPRRIVVVEQRGIAVGIPEAHKFVIYARLRVRPAVVEPWFASFPVICEAREEDALVARGEHGTADKNPDHSAAILYKPQGWV